MKTLKFSPNLVEKVLDGTKTVTWRLFDDKELTVGDTIEFLDSRTREKFATARIVAARVKELGDIKEDDLKGHEIYKSKDEMLKTYKSYYGNKVDWDTPVKIIEFRLL